MIAHYVKGIDQCCVACRCLVKNSNAVIELQLNRPVCVELYKDYKALGRFMMRYAGSTIAAGLITEVYTLTMIISSYKLFHRYYCMQSAGHE